jgi:transposase
MKITTIGLDLAKNVFQVHGADREGRAVLSKRLRRSAVLGFFAGQEPCLVGMEACAGAHYWARELSTLGHEVRLMPPQYVKPYVKRNKNDAADAAGICEAVTRPTMRFVPVKSTERQSVLMLHRARELLIRQRTMIVNALRGHFAEFGIVVAQGVHNVRKLVEILADRDERRLPDLARKVLGLLVEQLLAVETKVRALERELLAWHRANDASRRLATIPGVGPITASAIVATVGDGQQFRSGRQFAAWIGLVPRQNSSGGKARLGRISKRGDAYLRRLLVHGARAVVRWRRTDTAPSWRWLAGLVSRRPTNVATVALANKTARIAWAILTRQETYRTASMPAAA